MKISREFRVPDWNDGSARAAAEYLRTRGFADARVQSEGPLLVVSGSRGSWIGNFTSFDMRKLRGRITVSGDGSGRVGVELHINTLGQQVTEWNRAFWRLELVELCAVTSGRAPIAEVWARYSQPRRRSAILWSLTGALFGRRLTPEWVAELDRLESCFLRTGATSRLLP